MTWDHPRSRGENSVRQKACQQSTGSSPLTRGKPRDATVKPPPPGIIPAHAGKTQLSSAATSPPWDHPRSRGENILVPSSSVNGKGSSPLTRGKPPLESHQSRSPRIIPAHAGKTTPDGGRGGVSRDHPRSRGENGQGAVVTDRVPGSSPLTRGKRGASRAEDDFDGIIPAHAGKTFFIPARLPPGPDHPRSRGENPFLTCAFIAQIGQILESLELCASSESYSSPEAYATDALQGRVRSIDLGLRSSRGAS